jgi:hypothetical protein
VVTTQAAGTTTLTASLGRVASEYEDYVEDSDIKAANGTVYGDATSEVGASLESKTGDVLSFSGTTSVFLRFVSTGANLDQVTGSTGEVLFLLRKLPRAVLGSASPVRVSSPVTMQVIQRDETTGDIEIAGELPTGTASIEARHAGGSWATIATDEDGAFTGTLEGQATGNGDLELRTVGGEVVTHIPNVAVGEIFIIAGQSNASGYATNNQVYDGASVCRNFSNAYKWGACSDPIDSPTGQVDTVSRETALSGGFGSPWPRVASALDFPVALVPCALGGTIISQWLPGADHFDRATLYGSCAYRTQQTGARVWLWWQGESDAFQGLAEATYNSRLDTLANAIQADLGVKLMAFRLQNSGGATDFFENAIRSAVNTAIGDNANVLAGPDLSDLASDDAYHIQTNQKIQTVADRTVAALEAAFGW